MKSSLQQRLLALMTMVASAFSLQAHNIWIEDSGGAMILRFGEIGQKIETSPGRLDAFTGLQAWTVSTNQFKVEKKQDHFVIQGASAAGAMLAEEQMLAVSSRTNQAPRKSLFYARWQPANSGAGEAGLTLDIVPAAKAGEYRVYFRRQPLAGAKVAVEADNGFSAELTADTEGRLTFVPKSKGLYLLVCAHRETAAGFFGGKSYEGLNHSSTLSFRQP